MLFVTLDTTDGTVRRWRRGPLGQAEKLGEDKFTNWLSIRHLEEKIYEWLQAFRAAWAPPEEPTPSAPPSNRVSKAA